MIKSDQSTDCIDYKNAMEPVLSDLLDLRLKNRKKGPYHARNDNQVTTGLNQLFRAQGLTNYQIKNIRRMGGGASKEQFLFDYKNEDSDLFQSLVLRMDPLAGIVETSRKREAELLNAIQGVVPAPKVAFLDADGSHLGGPGMIMHYVDGVTKPTEMQNEASGLSGLGTSYGERLIKALSPQFIQHMVSIHDFDYKSAHLPSFAIPTGDPTTTALWQVNYWSRVWREDSVEPSPLMAITEAWLRDNLPDCENPVLLHGDYRIGNFMFDEKSGLITAILDWELAHIGDIHEELAFNLQPIFCPQDENGNALVASMFSREDFLRLYEETSGRTVDEKTLLFYEILNYYKLFTINNASATRVAKEGLTHQNVLLSFVSSLGHTIASGLIRILKEKAL